MDKNKVQALEGQSLLDLAIQTAGSVEAAIEMAMSNDVSISDDVDLVEKRVVEVRNKRIEQYYTQRDIKPATAITDKGQIFEDVFNEVFA